VAIRFHDAGPSGAAEMGLPVVGRFVSVGSLAVTEDKHVPLAAVGRSRECGLERGMLVGAVVGNKICNDPQVQAVGFVDEGIEVREAAEQRIDIAIVADVITCVPLR